MIPCYTRAISERFRDKELIIKRYINLPSLLFYIQHIGVQMKEHSDGVYNSAKTQRTTDAT